MNKNFLLLLMIVCLTACGGDPTKRVFPPKASVQELAVQANGQWRLTIRLQNFSGVPMTYTRLDAKLVIENQDAGHLLLTPNLTVGPESADVVTATLLPGAAAKVAIASALAGQTSVRYSLSGKITTREPSGDYDFSYDSVLNPAPGLRGVLR